MESNYHVLLVHFPIALLSLYAVMEIIRWPKNVSIKRAFLWTGAVLAVPTLLAGLAIEPRYEALGRVLMLHKTFALASLATFGVLALAYAAVYVLGKKDPAIRSGGEQKILAFAEVITTAPLAPLLAALGLACLVVTGALGGAMAHGANVDPFVRFIYELLVR